MTTENPELLFSGNTNQKSDSTLSCHLAIAALQAKINGSSCNEVKPMAVRQRRYSKEELARRGQALYESSIQQQVESGNTGKIVAIDIETGAFEVADHILPATNQLFKRYPNAQPWVIRIGHRAVYHFGSRSLIKPK
ncbi:MAG: hypothetical protein VKL42_17285 [Snowella sp.]|nr:hypothetical protein [Snowella sp.]